MKKNIFIACLIELIYLAVAYYIALPAINIQSGGFWAFIIVALGIFTFLMVIAYYGFSSKTIKIRDRKTPLLITIPISLIAFIVVGMVVINIICSPLLNAKSYSKRISIDESREFSKDIAEVNFNSLPLLDKESSSKLGDLNHQGESN